MKKVAKPPLDRLERTIASRAANPNPKSYTSQLLAGGVEKIGAKVTEEAAEVVEAAGEADLGGREHFIREVGDLVYHLLVLMRYRDCSLADLEAELARRFGVSGLEEKVSRKTAVPAVKGAAPLKNVKRKAASNRRPKAKSKTTRKAKR
jgi:phosphoribosyl-ATP pyrophosphohydrolase